MIQYFEPNVTLCSHPESRKEQLQQEEREGSAGQ